MTIEVQPLLATALAVAAPQPAATGRPWHKPRPSAALMWILGIANRWLFLKGLPVLRKIPIVRDLPFVHGYFWVRGVDLPDDDRRRLSSAVNRETVAFLSPNHPEFGTDWMIDKEVSSFVAPRMASWADRGIVSAAPAFWGMNNLVANDGGDAARDYSVEWALKGEGVLLHPEGTVRWTNDQIQPLFPGIAQMAAKAAQRTEKPVYIVPLVWKYRYVGNVSRRIPREMSILERGLGLPRMDGGSLPVRFHALQTNILTMRMRRFGYDAASASGHFFERQRAFQQWLVDTLVRRYPTDIADDTDRGIVKLGRAIRSRRSALENDASPGAAEQRARLEREMQMADEAKRLGEFSREVYGTPNLTQEQLFETLKRTRDRLLVHSWKDKVANMIPRPFGPRIVHIGVPEPIRVDKVDAALRKAYEAGLVNLTRARMQEKLDEINRRIAPEVERHSHPNPFADHGAG